MLTPKNPTYIPNPSSPQQWLTEPVWQEAQRPDGLVQYGHNSHPVPFKTVVPTYIKCVDIDGDGKVELIRHGSFHREEVYRQVGSAQCPGLDHTHVGALFPHPFNFRQKWNNVGWYPSERRRGIEVVDWDGDGQLEVIIVKIDFRSDVEHGSPATLELYRLDRSSSGPKATCSQSIRTPDGPLNVGSDACIRVADLDCDGQLELLFACCPEEFTAGPNLYLCRMISAWPPVVTPPRPVWLGGKPLTAYAQAHTCIDLVDWDGDGRIDLLFGSMIDEKVYFARNNGQIDLNSLEKPTPIKTTDGPLRFPEHAPYPCAVDWDGDGELDLVASTRPGFIYFAKTLSRENNGCPILSPPKRIEIPAESAVHAPVAVGFYVTVDVADWDGDGRKDLIVGCETGQLVFVKNIGQDNDWQFAAPEYLTTADGEEIRLTDAADGVVDATLYGSLAAANYGYTAPTVVDLNGDGVLDIITSTQLPWLYIIENIGTAAEPKLQTPRRVIADGREYVSLCRVRPGIADFNGDGVVDLVHCDCSSFLTLRHGKMTDNGLQFGQAKYLLDTNGNRIKLRPSHPEYDPKEYGRYWNDSGRAGIHVVDWDGDGRFDILIGTVAWSSIFEDCEIIYLKNQGSNDEPIFEIKRMMIDGQPFIQPRGDHDVSVTAVDWNHDGVLDLVVGTTDGWIYWYDGRRCSR